MIAGSRWLARVGVALLACVCVVSPALAQQRPAPAGGSQASAEEDPPPPVPPAVISRGANGRMEVRATRLTQPLRIDGRLDEAIYASVPAITDFIQTVPAEGQPSTEKTEAWVFFDDNYLYVSGRMYEDVPASQWTANELRRDTAQLRQNDMFGVLFDTFHDRRNGFNFYTNPLGGFADQIVTDEGNPNVDWNPVWEVRTGRFVPLRAGGRVTGKAGKYSIGLLNIETGAEEVSGTPATNFTVARVKRDILRRSSIGMLVTNRSDSNVVRGASNFAYGADAACSFFQNVSMGAFYSRSTVEGKNDDNQSYQGRFDYAADRYGAQLQFLNVGANYNPEVGFVRRFGFDRTYASARFSPRARTHFKGVRQFTYQGSLEYIENAAGQLETRNQTGRFALERQNSDLFVVVGGTNYELLVAPFAIAPGVRIPSGGYPFNDVTVSYQLGQQRRLNGTVSLQRGAFYNGTITGYGLTGARFAILKQWSLEPSLQVNDVTLPAGNFTTTLLRARTDYGFTPRMFMSGLVQYSSTGNLFQQQPALQVGVPPGERAVRGLHRRARHDQARLPGHEEPRLRREGEQAPAVLSTRHHESHEGRDAPLVPLGSAAVFVPS